LSKKGGRLFFSRGAGGAGVDEFFYEKRERSLFSAKESKLQQGRRLVVALSKGEGEEMSANERRHGIPLKTKKGNTKHRRENCKMGKEILLSPPSDSIWKGGNDTRKKEEKKEEGKKRDIFSVFWTKGELELSWKGERLRSFREGVVNPLRPGNRYTTKGATSSRRSAWRKETKSPTG